VFVPTELGGLGLTIPEAVRVFERVSALDASTGWTLIILNSGALFARFFPEQVFATVGRDPTALIAGSLNPLAARAEPVDGGYLFSGRATYLSGSAHARWIMASALVMKDEAPVLADGASKFAAACSRSSRRGRSTRGTSRACARPAVPTTSSTVSWSRAIGRSSPSGRARARPSDVFSAIPLWAQLGGLAPAQSARPAT
jgi:hypothetical protein